MPDPLVIAARLAARLASHWHALSHDDQLETGSSADALPSVSDAAAASRIGPLSIWALVRVAPWQDLATHTYQNSSEMHLMIRRHHHRRHRSPSPDSELVLVRFGGLPVPSQVIPPRSQNDTPGFAGVQLPQVSEDSPPPLDIYVAASSFGHAGAGVFWDGAWLFLTTRTSWTPCLQWRMLRIDGI